MTMGWRKSGTNTQKHTFRLQNTFLSYEMIYKTQHDKIEKA